jgi:hypothetical protein
MLLLVLHREQGDESDQSRPNVVGCVVDTHDVMAIKSIMLKHDSPPISQAIAHVPSVYLRKLCSDPGKKMLL